MALILMLRCRTQYFAEAAAAVAHEALATGKTIREVVISRGHVERGDLTEEQLDTALDVLAMTRPSTK